MQLTSLKEYFDNIYSDELNTLTIPAINAESNDLESQPIFSSLGKSILLSPDNPDQRFAGHPVVYSDALKWFFRRVSDEFYKCMLGHCDDDCSCKQPISGIDPRWRFFDIAEHGRYRVIANELRKHLFSEAGVPLFENSYEELIELAREEKHKNKLESINEGIADYLVDQIVIDYAYYETDGYLEDDFNISEEEFFVLRTIAKNRHRYSQPLSTELEAFLVYNIGVSKRRPSGKRDRKNIPLDKQRGFRPSIGNRSIDYRIMHMIKERADAEGLDYKKLENVNARGFNTIIEDVCDVINGWDFFQKVKRKKDGGNETEDHTIKAVRDRYFAKHPT